MLPLLTEQRLLLMKNRSLVRTDTVPDTTEDQIVFKNIWIHASWHIIIYTEGEEKIRKCLMGTGHRHLLQLPRTLNKHSKLVKQRPISFEFLRHARFIVGKTKVFPDLHKPKCITNRYTHNYTHKHNHKQYVTNTSQYLFMWLSTTRACIRRAGRMLYLEKWDLGLSALKLYLIIIHMGPEEGTGS